MHLGQHVRESVQHVRESVNLINMLAYSDNNEKGDLLPSAGRYWRSVGKLNFLALK